MRFITVTTRREKLETLINVDNIDYIREKDGESYIHFGENSGITANQSLSEIKDMINQL